MTLVGSISGKVTDSSNVAAVNICVIAKDLTGNLVGFDFTDGNGNYTIRELETGNYVIQFEDCGPDEFVGEYYNDKPSFSTANPVAVTAGSVTPNINAQLTRAGSISGKVTDGSNNPANGICVTAYDFRGDPVQFASTDAGGNYTISGLAPASYRVRFRDCPPGNLAIEFYDDKPSLANAQPVAVAAGSVTQNINAQLVPGGSLSGTVTDGSGSPLSDVCVDAYASDGGLVSDSGYTDAGGNYTISGLKAGNYRVRFFDCGPLEFSDEYYNDKRSLATANPVTVTTGTVAANINAQLAPAGSISGTVTSSSGAVLENICVDAYDSNGEMVGDGRSVDSGVYVVRGLPTGSYRLRFHDCGSGLFTSEYYDDKASLAAANPVAVTAGSDTPGKDVELVPDTTPPDTVIDSGPSGTIKTNSATFTFSGSPADDTAKIQCKIDGEAFTDCTSPKAFSGLSDGPHTAAFRAEDAAGNQDPTPATRTFTVDATLPDPPDPPDVLKARISKVSASGPKKVRKGKKATYKVKVMNSGNAVAKGVNLKVSGKGVKGKKSIGNIPAGKSKSVKVKLKPKKPGKIKVSFKVTSKNAGGKTVKKKITIKK